MTDRRRRFRSALGFYLVVTAMTCAQAEPTSAALLTFHEYTAALEQKLARRHQSGQDFIAATPDSDRIRRGQICIEQVLPPDEGLLPGALLLHWRGTAFLRGATAADFEHLLRKVDAYPSIFAPQVLAATKLAEQGNDARFSMRIRQHHVLTVVLDSTYDIMYGQLDLQNRYSIAHSIRVVEIEAPGTGHERPLSAAEEHGFLWRQNTYWSYAERDGGLYMQLESVSLARSIPMGISWAIAPLTEKIPRESLEFTLSAARNALRR